ncbi:N,N-dimethylformamidase beta subunit family domain-containing protein [Arthrobacter sp. GCM10027362]|uniref:N,N-dimethylformamidase beta subunit family domain-containing protein n=1 Tax=Arthrobacter sp. GCM10027362 TaxID=3273379 RepID=UPI003629BEDF
MNGPASGPGRREVLAGTLAAFALAACRGVPGNRPSAAANAAPAAGSAPRAPARAFSYLAENRLPGTPGGPVHWISNGRLEGFLDRTASTPAHRILRLYASSVLGAAGIQAFRLGNYGGAGRRLVWESGPVPVRQQKPYTVDPQTKMVSCPWDTTAEIDTSAWPEGFYHLVLTAGGAREHLIPLVVESASLRARTVLAFNDVTMQAYNRWGGYSLYAGPDDRSPDRSYKVSFDRPYLDFDEPDNHDTPLVRAAEAIDDERVSLGYTTESRLAARPGLLAGSTAVLFSGHSEYWSVPMRRGIEAARDRGTNIVFFGANSCYWKTRMEPSALGRDRVIVCYKSPVLDPVRYSRPGLVTVRWRDSPSRDPESLLTGAMYADLHAVGNFTVGDPHFFAFAGTGASRRQEFPGLVGGEVDRVLPGYPVPANLRIFAHSPASGDRHRHGWADAVMYVAASGAGVLNLASMNWLPAQASPLTPERSRRFALKVTQNIIRAVAAGPRTIS